MNMDTLLLRRVLGARERRYLARQELARSVRASSLVELTLNVPGWPKVGEPFDGVFRAAVRETRAALGVDPVETRVDAAGHYALFLSELPVEEVKRRACRIEEQAPWARLLDIDCHGAAGKLRREAVGVSPRRCLLCMAPHEACITSRRHPLEELRDAATRLAAAFREGPAGPDR